MLRDEPGGDLPSIYQRVEYIGISASGPYLETNYTPVRGDEIECGYRINGAAVAALFSAGTGKYQTVFVADTSNGRYYVKAFQTGSATDVTIWNGNKANILLKNPTSVFSVSSGDVSVSTPFQGALDGNETNLRLFRRRNGDAGVASLIYSFTIANGGATKLDLIPCYRKADGTIGMYDTVSGSFFTNAGTGTFTKGADV